MNTPDPSYQAALNLLEKLATPSSSDYGFYYMPLFTEDNFVQLLKTGDGKSQFTPFSFPHIEGGFVGLGYDGTQEMPDIRWAIHFKSEKSIDGLIAALNEAKTLLPDYKTPEGDAV